MKRPTIIAGFRHTGRRRTVAVTAAVVVGLTLPLIGSVPASATIGQWEPIHEQGTYVLQDFCAPGLTVETSYAVVGRARTTLRGSDRLPYYQDFSRSTNTFTNVATGEATTVRSIERSADHKVTDNGDGTLSVINQNYGIVTFYDGNGKRINLIAGRLYGFEALIDHGGTPSDPSDDEQLAVVRDLGGKFELCPTLLRAIG